MKTGRRYSEFLWLFDQLLQYDRCAIIPPLPEKVSPLSTLLTLPTIPSLSSSLSLPPSLFSPPLSSPPPLQVMTLSKYDKAFLRYRQKELTRFLQRVGAHHSLSLCPALKTFMTKGGWGGGERELKGREKRKIFIFEYIFEFFPPLIITFSPFCSLLSFSRCSPKPFFFCPREILFFRRGLVFFFGRYNFNYFWRE